MPRMMRKALNRVALAKAVQLLRGAFRTPCVSIRGGKATYALGHTNSGMNLMRRDRSQWYPADGIKYVRQNASAAMIVVV